MYMYMYILILVLVIIVILLILNNNLDRLFDFIKREYKHNIPFVGKKIIMYDYNHDVDKTRNRLIEYKEIHNVPNNIFQIYIKQDKLADEIIDNINYLKMKNPTWRYHLITDKNIDRWLRSINDPEYIKIYHDISPDYPAAKCDILRYLLMKHYGGVYLDIKSSCKYSLDEIIEPKIMLFRWCVLEVAQKGFLCYFDRRKRKYPDELVQWLLIYPKGHYFIDAVLHNIKLEYEKYKKDPKLIQDIYAFTGPDVYTDTIMPLLNDDNSILYISFTDKGFLYNILKYHHKFYSKNKHYLDLKVKIIEPDV